MQAVSHSSESDVPVELDAELAGVVVHADKRRIVRVIANLLDNAAKYAGGAPPGTVRKSQSGSRSSAQHPRPGSPIQTARPSSTALLTGYTSGGAGSG